MQFDLFPGFSLNANESMFVRVESASIPVVRPNLNPGNNVLTLQTGADQFLSAVIPVGNYTSGTDLATAMSATISFQVAGLSCSYSKFSNKLTFEHSQSQSITIITATSTMQLVGINELDNLVIPSGVATTTPRMLDLSGAKSILISCESFELDSMDSQKSIGSNTTNLLACIPQTVAYGDILTYKTDAAPFILARRKNLSTISIELLDENQTAYDTQGLPWSCVLDVDIR